MTTLSSSMCDQNVIQREFETKRDDLDENLHDIFENAQNIARQHMDDVFNIPRQRYEAILKEKDDKLQQMQSAKESLLQKSSEDKEKQSTYVSNFKDNMATYLTNKQARQNDKYVKLRVLSAWSRLFKDKMNRTRLESLAETVSKNVSKTRVFSRFAYNLVSRNYEGEKRQYLRNFNEQSKKLVARYEHDVGLLQHRLAAAEAAAAKELALRQRLEEDIRSMLLKNLSSMNVEAVNVLKQPLLLYPLADEIPPPAYHLSGQSVSGESVDYIANFKNFFNNNITTVCETGNKNSRDRKSPPKKQTKSMVRSKY